MGKELNISNRYGLGKLNVMKVKKVDSFKKERVINSVKIVC